MDFEQKFLECVLTGFMGLVGYLLNRILNRLTTYEDRYNNLEKKVAINSTDISHLKEKKFMNIVK